MRQLLLLGALAAAACTARSTSPAEPPLRAQARAAVLSIAEGVVIVDKTCAFVSRERKDLDLATSCGGDYKSARDALLAAERALDDGELARAGCEAVPAIRALGSMIRHAGALKEPALDDALAMAARFQALVPCGSADGGAR